MKHIAKDAGIDVIGAVRLDILDALLVKYRSDVRKLAFFRGSLADRLNYKNVWPQTKGILSFGVSYKHDCEEPKDGKARVKIASSAYGQDYHRVLHGKAEAFMQELRKQNPCSYKIYADTGVLSDRALAYAAGLGFYGKNGFVIHPDYGSYLFLGHILLDIELKSEVLPPDRLCGDCRKCIDACPNHAYHEPYGLDYERCISYQTQTTARCDTKSYIYGCDICQDVCPFNEAAPAGLHSEFKPEREIAFPAIQKILSMNEAEFENLYGVSSLAWRGLDTLKENCRNVLKYKK